VLPQKLVQHVGAVGDAVAVYRFGGDRISRHHADDVAAEVE
jgi:hypothetical protein